MAGQVGRAFIDANVLYSRTTRDWLGLLYTDDRIDPPFRVFWSEDVLAEAIYHLRRNNPSWDGQKIADIRDRLAATFEDGRVSAFEIDGTYSGADPQDAHVHAAAIACQADYLVTQNTRDFRDPAADERPYEVVTCDEFFTLVDDVSSKLVNRAVKRQINYWKRRKADVDLAGALVRADCPGFAERVVKHLRRQALRP